MWTVNGLAMNVMGAPSLGAVVVTLLVGLTFLWGCMGWLQWVVRYVERKRLHQSSNADFPFQLVLVVSHGEQTIEGVLRAAWGKSVRIKSRRIIVIDTDGSTETEAIVKLFARDHSGVEYRHVTTDEALAEQLQEARTLMGSPRMVYDLRQGFSLRQFGDAIARQIRG